MPLLLKARRALVGLSLLLVLPAHAAAVSATPDPTGLPGQEKLQKILNGLYSWSLIIALGALVVAAMIWAVGAHSSNYSAAARGRTGVVGAALAALLIGAGPTIVNFFYALGRG